MFWLSHHSPDEWNRTYSIAGTRVCARCLGTYPTLFFAFLVQARTGAALKWTHEVLAVLLLTMPALADWGWGRLFPESGSNAVRTLSGILLGLALARSLYVHVRSPWPPVLLWQLALVLSVALPILGLAYRRRRG